MVNHTIQSLRVTVNYCSICLSLVFPGMDRTYQREDLGNHGFAAKIVPEFSEKKKQIFRGCLHHIGSKRFPIKAQSIVPSEKFFKVSLRPNPFNGELLYKKTFNV